MKFLIKFQLSIEHGNKVAQDPNTMNKLDEFMNKMKVEYSYFLLEDGKRTGVFIVNIDNTDMIPSFTEPILQEFNANVDIYPIMGYQELKKGYSILG